MTEAGGGFPVPAAGHDRWVVGPNPWNRRNGAGRCSGGPVPGVALFGTAERDLIAEPDGEVSCSQSGDQDAVPAAPQGDLDHAVDRAVEAVVRGGPVTDPDLDDGISRGVHGLPLRAR